VAVRRPTGERQPVKLVIVSDVHGNLAALDAVQADLEVVRPELVVHGGDLALNGPRPAECIDRIRELGWPGIVGNTDQALWALPDSLPANTINTFRVLVTATSGLLGRERVHWLQSLPLHWRGADRVALVHAIPGDTWKGVLPDASDEELRATYRSLGAAIAVYCHIHRPFVRRLDGLIVANSGSVGLPWDGDTRASYLLVEDGEPVVRRVEYDIERHMADLTRSGYPSSRWLAEQARTAAGGFVKLDE
jgi:putative phosphoesterase